MPAVPGAGAALRARRQRLRALCGGPAHPPAQKDGRSQVPQPLPAAPLQPAPAAGHRAARAWPERFHGHRELPGAGGSSRALQDPSPSSSCNRHCAGAIPQDWPRCSSRHTQWLRVAVAPLLFAMNSLVNGKKWVIVASLSLPSSKIWTS